MSDDKKPEPGKDDMPPNPTLVPPEPPDSKQSDVEPPKTQADPSQQPS